MQQHQQTGPRGIQAAIPDRAERPRAAPCTSEGFYDINKERREDRHTTEEGKNPETRKARGTERGRDSCRKKKTKITRQANSRTQHATHVCSSHLRLCSFAPAQVAQLQSTTHEQAKDIEKLIRENEQLKRQTGQTDKNTYAKITALEKKLEAVTKQHAEVGKCIWFCEEARVQCASRVLVFVHVRVHVRARVWLLVLILKFLQHNNGMD